MCVCVFVKKEGRFWRQQQNQQQQKRIYEGITKKNKTKEKKEEVTQKRVSKQKKNRDTATPRLFIYLFAFYMESSLFFLSLFLFLLLFEFYLNKETHMFYFF